MIDLNRLQKLRLHTKPALQIALGKTFFWLDFRFPKRTRISMEGLENLPTDRPSIVVTNHTDRYGYFPLLYYLWKAKHPFFFAVWIKGKYYTNPLMGKFFDHVNGIPVPSRGYVIVVNFKKALGRLPTDGEYRVLRDWMEEKISDQEFESRASDDLKTIVHGRFGDFDPSRESYAGYLDRTYREMMALVLKHSVDALTEKNLNLLVYPEGTRSRKLQKARNGVAQLAIFLRTPIVPIGSNGTDRCYPGSIPLSKGCEIVFRVGKPVTPDGEMKKFLIDEPFVPFTRDAEVKHREAFDGLADLITRRIDELLDPEYRMEENPQERKGVGRFI